MNVIISLVYLIRKFTPPPLSLSLEYTRLNQHSGFQF